MPTSNAPEPVSFPWGFVSSHAIVSQRLTRPQESGQQKGESGRKREKKYSTGGVLSEPLCYSHFILFVWSHPGYVLRVTLPVALKTSPLLPRPHLIAASREVAPQSTITVNPIGSDPGSPPPLLSQFGKSSFNFHGFTALSERSKYGYGKWTDLRGGYGKWTWKTLSNHTSLWK